MAKNERYAVVPAWDGNPIPGAKPVSTHGDYHAALIDAADRDDKAMGDSDGAPPPFFVVIDNGEG